MGPQAQNLIICLQFEVLLVLAAPYCPGYQRLILSSCLKPGRNNPPARGCRSPVLSQQASPWENVLVRLTPQKHPLQHVLNKNICTYLYSTSQRDESPSPRRAQSRAGPATGHPHPAPSAQQKRRTCGGGPRLTARTPARYGGNELLPINSIAPHRSEQAAPRRAPRRLELGKCGRCWSWALRWLLPRSCPWEKRINPPPVGQRDECRWPCCLRGGG